MDRLRVVFESDSSRLAPYGRIQCEECHMLIYDDFIAAEAQRELAACVGTQSDIAVSMERSTRSHVLQM
jgi:hypothetical protein